MNRVIIGHLNINSIRNKFNQLKEVLKDRIDILMISETKVDSTFPESQFIMPGYSKPYRLDRTRYGGGLIIYVREDIPSKILKQYCFPNDVECMLLEIKLHKKKWILCGGYNPHNNSINYFLEHISKAMDTYLDQYDNMLLLGDFNCEETNIVMKTFFDTYNLKNLIKEPTCFKNTENPSCIDFIVTNKERSFAHTKIIETGLSDHHKLVLTVLKTYYVRPKAKTVTYRCYKKFNEADFRHDLEEQLAKTNLQNCQHFEGTYLTVLNKHAPCKKKLVRANESPFMNKHVKKAIMNRSRLRNKYLKNNTETNRTNYKKMRNYCVNLVKRCKK